MLIEDMAGADGKPVAYPVMQTPVIEHLVGNEPGEFGLLDLEWMFEQDPVATAPGIDLGFPPATLKPVAINQREFSDRLAHGSTQGETLFHLRLSIGRPRLAVKI